jgi:hypothetical protein
MDFEGDGWCRMKLDPLRRRPGAKVKTRRNRGILSVGTWLSLVEHSLGVRGVGSSNLPVPTNSKTVNEIQTATPNHEGE